jgi:uncharacterized phage-associated protein
VETTHLLIAKTPMLNLSFDESKATEAAAFLLSCSDQTMNYMKLIKLLYLADREALIRWGRPISTDRYVSMKHGPVLSNVLNLINFGSLSEKAGSWSSLISTSGYDISLEQAISEEDFEELSVAERKLLDEIWRKYGALDEWELVELLHDVGEWQDPHGTSVPISYSEILRAGGRSKDFIAAVEGELSAVDKKNRMRPDLDVLDCR